MNKHSRIFLAGHRGMVGSALLRALRSQGFSNIVTATSGELDLRDTTSVRVFFERERPEFVLLAAAKVGGIQANCRFPGEFLRDNLMIQTNVIHQSHLSGVRKLMFLGSSCIYPRECPQPMKEQYLMTGALEPTNEGYALAKIAGIRMAQYYERQYGLQTVCPIPCNLYGPNDNFDPATSHVLSALIKKFVDAVDSQAEEVVLWGTGSARRELMHVDDAARALLFLMEEWHSSEIVNVGTGTDVCIRELAELIARKVTYTGRILWDTSMPDGMPRKCLDVSKIAGLGYHHQVQLNEGIEQMVCEYRSRRNSASLGAHHGERGTL